MSRFVDNRFVPRCLGLPSVSELNALKDFLNGSSRLLILTGAGISTESGIPDYRSPEVGLYARSNHRPVQYQDFLKSAHVRQRYWARNFTAWPVYSSVQPNNSHQILSKWEKEGRVDWLITQNVDNLHRSAGTQHLIEMHGNTHQVTCLQCEHHMSRHELQDLIKSKNPDWGITSDKLAPDGDVMLSNEDIQQFQVPTCPSCQTGILKPDIIFFGDNLPQKLRDLLTRRIHECDSILCLGTSLQTFSSFRLVNLAHQQSKPIVMVSIGPSRADNLLKLKLEARISDVLSTMDKR